MKKLLIAVIVLALFATSSFAGFNIGAFGGYTTVSMSDVNALIDDMVDGAPPLDEDTRFGNAWIVGFDLGVSPIEILSIGARVEIIGAAAARVALDDESYEWGGMIVPIMAGAVLNYPIPDSPVTVGGNLHLGYGLASSYMQIKFGSIVDEKALYEGGCFAMEIGGKLGFQISDMVSLGINLGYRIASVAEMKASADNDDMGVEKGDVPENMDGDPLVFDYSGFLVGGGITLSF